MSRPMLRGTPRRLSASMPGHIAAAMMNARKSSAITSFSFQSASATATIPMTTSVAIAALLAVSFMTRDFSPQGEGGKPMVRSPSEQVCLDDRRHAIVLAGPLLRAVGLAAGGASGFVLGWPLSAVRVVRVGAVEIEQSVLGRLLGYGTVVAGDLEITHVPEPRRLVERMSH